MGSYESIGAYTTEPHAREPPRMPRLISPPRFSFPSTAFLMPFTPFVVHWTATRRFETPGHRRKRLEASKLNADAAIYALPPELLSDIFLFCVSATSREVTGLDWLAITHVTRRWRQVALNCPELWANIILRRKLVPIMLARAKMVPLVIKVVLGDHRPYQVQQIRDNISRVGELAISGPDAATLDTFFLDYVGNSSAPRLRSLSVINTSSSSRDPLWLDAMIFHGKEEPKTPPTRQLHLEKCAIPWNSPWYHNLTDLYLANLSRAQGPTITTLFSVIVASPLLQNLTLINTRTHVDRWERFFPITLSHLVRLHISEPIYVCAQILMNLTFPSVVTNEKEMWLIPNLVSHHDFNEEYNFVRIEAPTNSFLRLKAGGYWTDKTLDIQIDHWIPQNILDPVLKSVATYSPTCFQSITSLSIDMPFLQVDAWQHLCQCTNLTTLSLEKNDSLAVLALLLERAFRCVGVSVRGETQTHLDSDGACTQLFPNLSCVILKDIDCGDLTRYPSNTDVLRALLWARRAGRCPIAQVKFRGCKNRTCTDSFTWDGVGQNTEEKEDGGYLDLRSYSLNVLLMCTNFE
ncbi:hypothetical protein C8R46DRAFT_1070365 [Mycena filopes]|nr:hypothetical protein C8R46DRAFT_1070365 [Mycena filopes]